MNPDGFTAIIRSGTGGLPFEMVIFLFVRTKNSNFREISHSPAAPMEESTEQQINASKSRNIILEYPPFKTFVFWFYYFDSQGARSAPGEASR
jgi:hypothetical protein